LIPPLRAYIRYVPFAVGKRWLWNRVVDPYFAWQPYDFVATTLFGSRVAGNTTDILEQYLYYFGIWEPNFTHWLGRRLGPGDTFIDVGANIGYYSLLASWLVGESGSVVAIEASPTTYRALQANLARNRVRNVRALNVAVSDSRGLAKLFRGPEGNHGLSTVLETESLRYHCQFECEVETAPLAELLRDEEIRRARLIKIDVEGAEWRVLAGMGPLLHSGRADLEVMVETSPQRLVNEGKNPTDLLKVFLQAGFHAYQLENDYSPESYLPRQQAKRPTPLRSPVECEMDILFSRQDAELL
jgi:FkbM family methyltransferase